MEHSRRITRLLAAVAVAACSSGPDTAPRSTSSTSPPVEVTILYGSEKRTWLEEQIAAFNASQRQIHVTGTPIGSGDAVQAILDGSQKPVVFSPASGAYITLLDEQWQSREGHTKPIAPAGEPLVLSPIVIAMWKPMAQALGWPDRPIGWADVLAVSRDPAGWGAYQHPEWGAMKLGHTHPERSSSGLLSVLAIAYASKHATRGLDADDLPRIEPYLRDVEAAIVHYGPSTGLFADKMIERGPSYLSAAVVYENLVIESYARPRSLDLVAIYPAEGTFWADHPYSVLDAPWVTPAERAGAAQFLAFVKARPQQERAMALGFRPADPAIPIAAPVDPAHGVDPRQPQTLLAVPDAPMLDALLATWRKTKKAADVVVVFDKSGSMQGRALAEAKAGAKAFLATLEPRDQVTLVVFDEKIYPAYGPVEVGTARAALESRIDGISADGGTALYDATLAAHDLLAARATASAHRIRAVLVMTDGADADSHHTLPEAVQALRSERGGISVFAIGYGDEPNRDALEALAQAGNGTFSRGNVDTIVGVFRDMAAFF